VKLLTPDPDVVVYWLIDPPASQDPEVKAKEGIL
jgi:hypothetical protein